jgi:hypothetical protein
LEPSGWSSVQSRLELLVLSFKVLATRLFSLCLLEAHHRFQVIVLDKEKERKQELIRRCGLNKDSEAISLIFTPSFFLQTPQVFDKKNYL